MEDQLINAILVTEREPTPADANEFGEVEAWDSEKLCWGKRDWYDFPSHPLWSTSQRIEILKRWTHWRPC